MTGAATTDETWLVDGVLLNTLAYNISTLSGRESIPPLDGDNIPFTNAPGRRFVPKRPDQRTITLAMWVRGTDEYGNFVGDHRGVFNDNWEKLKSLFGVYERELVVYRRIRFGAGLDTREARMQVANTMELEPQGDSAGVFVVDCVMADPFWYGMEEWRLGQAKLVAEGFTFDLTFDLVFDQPSTSPETTVDLSIPYWGTYFGDPVYTIFGPRNDPRIEHNETEEWFELDINLLADEFVEVHVATGEVKFMGVASRYNLVQPGSSWIRLQPRQTNNFTLRGTLGDGNFQVNWQPKFL